MKSKAANKAKEKGMSNAEYMAMEMKEKGVKKPVKKNSKKKMGSC